MAQEIINYQDFEKLDIRVGKIIDAKSPDWSEKLLEFEVDFGAEIGRRTIFSGIKKYYDPEIFKGRKYLFVVNLAEKKMGRGVRTFAFYSTNTILSSYHRSVARYGLTQEEATYGSRNPNSECSSQRPALR